MLFRMNRVILLGLAVLSASAVGTTNAGLVANWTFDNISSVTDASGNSHTGTTVGGVTQDAFGPVGNAYTFDGATGYITVPNASDLSGMPNLTYSYWFNTNGMATHTTQEVLFKGYNTGGGNSYQSLISYRTVPTTAEYIYGRCYVGTTSDQAYGACPISEGTWAQVVVTHNGSTGNTKLYFNGVDQNFTSSGNAVGSITTTVDPVMIAVGHSRKNGVETFSNFFSGSLDDVGMWSDSLTATQVNALYTAPLYTGGPLANGLHGTGLYNVSNMNKLFDVYTAQGAANAYTIGSGTNAVDWQYATDLPSGTAGATGYDAASHRFYILLGTGSDGKGVAGMPETSFLSGDANLDWIVNVADLTRLLNNYNKTGMNWMDGDFNADGTVNVADLTALLNNYNKSTWGSVVAGTAVPEPSSIAMWVGIALTALLCRQRKRT